MSARKNLAFEVDTDTQKLENPMGTIQLTSVRIKPSQKASMYWLESKLAGFYKWD